MSKASGLLVVAIAGLGMAYVLPWDSITDRSAVPAELDILSGQPSEGEASPTVTADGWRGLARPAMPPTDNPQLQPEAGRAPAASAPVVVTVAPRTSEPAARPQTAPLVAGDRFALTRELQRELKRVGCYDGEVSGVWTPTTRAAMKAFTGRVNATLPVEEPDLILVTLVQGHQDRVCGMACPFGQGPAADVRCVPHAILAQSARKAPQRTAAVEPTNTAPLAPRAGVAITGWSTTTTPVPPTLGAPPIEGRMALAGPADAALAASPLPPAVAAPQRPAPKRTGFGPSFFKELDKRGGSN